MSTNSLNSLAADLAAFDNYQFALESMDYLPTEQDYQDWMQCLQEEEETQEPQEEDAIVRNYGIPWWYTDEGIAASIKAWSETEEDAEDGDDFYGSDV